jgi:hypothetical protein
MLLYAYTIAYQLVYIIENEDSSDPGFIDGMYNRKQSHGRFGIWGHYLDDLVYNGISSIDFYHNSVVCKFSCDS